MRTPFRNGEQDAILRARGCPESVPDNFIIWLFCKRMDQRGFDKLVWEEFQRQLKRKKGLKIKKGSVKAAPCFLTRFALHCASGCNVLLWRNQRILPKIFTRVRKPKRVEIKIKRVKSWQITGRYIMDINFTQL